MIAALLLFPVENEVRSVIQSFPNWKVTGTDGIPTEIWKATEGAPVKGPPKLCQQIGKDQYRITKKNES